MKTSRVFMLRDFCLQVLCVLLLQNAGLKSKDVSARSMAIDFLGTIAARLKQDALICSGNKFWILQELSCGDDVDLSFPKDACCVCLDGRVENRLFMCPGCRRLFHADCMGVREHEAPNRSWHCMICLCKNQLLVLQSYSDSHYKDEEKKDNIRSKNNSDASDTVTKAEIVQQMLLNYLQDVVTADDAYLFVRWFVLYDAVSSPFKCFTVLFIREHVCAGFICACGTRMTRNLNKSLCTISLD